MISVHTMTSETNQKAGQLILSLIFQHGVEAHILGIALNNTIIPLQSAGHWGRQLYQNAKRIFH